MQAALHQNAGAAQVHGLLDLLENGFVREDVAFVVAHGPVEGAEAAIFGAEIRVVDVAIDDVADDAFRGAACGARRRRPCRCQPDRRWRTCRLLVDG